MIPFEVIVLLPAPEVAPSHQARESLLALSSRLEESGRQGRHVLALTFFVDATDPAGYGLQREDLSMLLPEFFDGPPPPWSVVAQAPEGRRRVALEAAVLASPAADVSVARPTCQGLSYTIVTGPTTGGVRQLHGAGIASDTGLDDTAARARDAFTKMEAILRDAGLTFDHVVRQWNYIEGLLDIQAAGCGRHQGYQAFNDVRTLAYETSEFPAGYPAATGIGQAAGGVVLEFLACDAPEDVSVVPFSNPRQVDAHRYSAGQLVGESLEDLPRKSTPKFERAKLVARGEEKVTFVSGTAAIVGERSVAPGDVAAQTRTTIDNIAALIGDRRLSRLRAYVKRAEDVAKVRTICEATFGPIPALYVRADICRDDLLVELEGALVIHAPEA
ncbi:MAG: chorismate transformation enzyme, FkbO/Hyg5 family [Planctomycetota bacterium]|jgi:enamine deaminase RidA (YjgF/YER057c/UK114 family)